MFLIDTGCWLLRVSPMEKMTQISCVLAKKAKERLQLTRSSKGEAAVHAKKQWPLSINKTIYREAADVFHNHFEIKAMYSLKNLEDKCCVFIKYGLIRQSWWSRIRFIWRQQLSSLIVKLNPCALFVKRFQFSMNLFTVYSCSLQLLESDEHTGWRRDR